MLPTTKHRFELGTLPGAENAPTLTVEQPVANPICGSPLGEPTRDILNSRPDAGAVTLGPWRARVATPSPSCVPQPSPELLIQLARTVGFERIVLVKSIAVAFIPERH